MIAPDRVFIGSPPKTTCYGIAYAEKRGFATLEYLLASPARLHAEELEEALRGMMGRYLELVNSGDAGNWDPELEDEVIASRAVLAKLDP